MLHLFKKISSTNTSGDEDVVDPPEIPVNRRQRDPEPPAQSLTPPQESCELETEERATESVPSATEEVMSIGSSSDLDLQTASAESRYFSFGNPSIDTIRGRLVLDKETASTRIAVVDVPTHETLVDFCEFITQHSQTLSQRVTHIQIFRQTTVEECDAMLSPDTASFYLILLNFSSIEYAVQFLKKFDDRQYNAIEEDKRCHAFYLYTALVYDRQVRSTSSTSDRSDEEEQWLDKNQLPLASQLVRVRSNKLGDQTQFIFPPAHHRPNDIPNCVICQEYVEDPENYDGSGPLTPNLRGLVSKTENEIFSALTPPPQSLQFEHLWAKTAIIVVLCGHLFHLPCLLQWRDNSCPVCRHCVCPEELPACDDCDLMTEDLWQCLVCGHLGCDRSTDETRRHAIRHFEETQHTYAKHIRTDRVWDYAQDDFVYRLIQNKSDGKYVALMGGDDEDETINTSKENYRQIQEWASNKQNEMMNELDFFLTQQLEIQKRTYCDQMKLAKANQRKVLEKLEFERSKLEKALAERQQELFGHPIPQLDLEQASMLDLDDELKQRDVTPEATESNHSDENEKDALATAHGEYNDELKTREKWKIMCQNMRDRLDRFPRERIKLERELEEEIESLKQLHQSQVLEKKNELRDFSSHFKAASQVSEQNLTQEDMASATMTQERTRRSRQGGSGKKKRGKGGKRGRGRRR